MNDFRNKNETIKDAEARRHAAHHPSPCPLPLRGEGSETVRLRPGVRLGAITGRACNEDRDHRSRLYKERGRG